MKVLIQWSALNPTDWEEIDSSEWSLLPKGPIPGPIDIINSNEKKWIHGINVQGVVFSGHDHYAIEDIVDGVKITVWDDDPVDWLNDYHAAEWTLLEPAFDVNVGQVNTRQSFVAYAEDLARRNAYAEIDICISSNNWNKFREPAAENVKHGIWVPDALNDQHLTVVNSRGWREWV